MVVSKKPAKLNKKDNNIILNELRDAIGAEKVKGDNVVLAAYASDFSAIPFRKPGFVVLPETREDVAETLKTANKYKIPVTAFARGVNMAGYSVPSEGGIVLDLRRMDRIIEINTDSGYAVIEPGVTFDQFAMALKKKGFRCPMPTSPGGSSPVGNYLSRPSQSMANKRLDAIVDLEVVLPDGTVFKTGSSHFPHAGSSLRYGPFPDLAGLFCTAYGTMGVVTKAAVTIYPVNEANRVNVAAFDNFPAALDFVKDIINNNIPEHCIIWNYHMAGWAKADPVLGMPDPRKAPEGIPYSTVTTFMSGYEETMITNEKVCEKVARKYGGRILSREEVEKSPNATGEWGQIFGEYHPVRRVRSTWPKGSSGGRYIPWIVLAEPKDMKNLEKWAVDQVEGLGVRPVCYYVQPFDLGRSIMFRIFNFPETTDQELINKVHAKYKEMFDVAMERYGAIPMRHRANYPHLDRTGSYADVLTRIKKTLDPNNILNRDVGMFQEDER